MPSDNTVANFYEEAKAMRERLESIYKKVGGLPEGFTHMEFCDLCKTYGEVADIDSNSETAYMCKTCYVAPRI